MSDFTDSFDHGLRKVFFGRMNAEPPPQYTNWLNVTLGGPNDPRTTDATEDVTIPLASAPKPRWYTRCELCADDPGFHARAEGFRVGLWPDHELRAHATAYHQLHC